MTPFHHAPHDDYLPRSFSQDVPDIAFLRCETGLVLDLDERDESCLAAPSGGRYVREV